MDAAVAHSYRDPHPLKLTSPASNVATYTDWKETTTHFTAPVGVASVEATLLPATYGHGTALKETSKVWLTDMTFTSLGTPVCEAEETIMTLAVPVENDDPLPHIRRIPTDDDVHAVVTHPDGTEDKISFSDRDGIRVWRGRKMTRIKVTIDGNELYEYLDFAPAFTEGFFAFQQHDPGSKVSIRKVEVMPLPD